MTNKLPKHVEKIWKDDDGWWAILKQGWHVDHCTGVHEDTKVKLLRRIRDAKPGEIQ